MQKSSDALGNPVIPAMSSEASEGTMPLWGGRNAVVTPDGQSLKNETLPFHFQTLNQSEQIFTQNATETTHGLELPVELRLTSQKREQLNLKIETYAKDFGYKGANLFILEEIAARLRALGWQVYVPKFLIISHEKNYSHLQKYYPSFETDLDRFVAAQKGQQELTREGCETLQKMREGVLLGFNNYPLELDLSAFDQRRRLMVRSSGHEDSKESSMAGAYTSVAGVPQENHEISKAIGAVIESYLTELSIAQRLLNRCEISDSVFVPVIIQEMIGEDINDNPNPNQLLRCGVCYTKEIGAETPDLIEIESAYGHNELVVNGGSCDTYYVYSSGESHQILEPKPTRLVANISQNGESKFIRKKNPSELSDAGSLSTDGQNLIKVSSIEIHNTYQSIMDIEWIFDPNENVLWFVQARPVVKKINFEPSMVDKRILKDVKMGEVIVHQGGKAVAITKREQIICTHTLANGCSRYLKLGKKGNPVRALIVAKPAGRLSHPACVLREKGVTVMYCPTFDVKTLERSDLGILIDTQQGIIGKIENAELASLTEEEVYAYLHKSSIITEGWFKHPIAAQESLQDYGIDESSARQLLRNLCQGVIVEERKISDLIISLSSENIEEGNQGVKRLTVILLRHLKTLSKAQTPIEKHLLTEGITLLRNVLIVGNQFLARKNRKQRLHAAKRLEALCYQEGSSRVLNSISLRTLLSRQKLTQAVNPSNIPLSKETLVAVKLLESNTHAKLQRMDTTKAVHSALSQPLSMTEKVNCQLVYQSMFPLLIGSESQKQWRIFTDTLLTTESRIANQLCVDLLTQLEKSGILSEWMMYSFTPTALRVQDPIGTLQALRDEWGKIRKTMKDVLILSTTFDTWKHNPTIWEDPTNFNALWMAFQNGPLKQLQKAIEHLIAVKNFTNIEKVLLCNAIKDGVETFDTAIKIMRGSSLDQSDQIVLHFSKMLIPYLDMMVILIESIPEGIFAEWASCALVDNKELTLLSYKKGILDLIKRAFDHCCKTLNSKQLYPTDHFNVQAACVNSGTFFNLEFSEAQVTLEDLFTLFHQNILAALECHRPRMDVDQFPSEARKVLSVLGNIDDAMNYSIYRIQLKTHLIGESIHYPFLISTYNLPIKNHSCKLVITYHLKNGDSEALYEIYGHNMNQRMEVIGTKLIFKSALEGLCIIEFPIYDETTQTLQMKWKVGNEPIRLRNLFIEAAKDTLRGNFGNITIFEKKELPDLDQSFWQNLLNNSGSLRHAFKGPCQYTITSILAYFLQDDCAISPIVRCQLIEEIGIQFDDHQKDKPFEQLLFDAFTTHLLEDKESILMEEVGFMMMIPIHPIKRLLMNLLEHLIALEDKSVKAFVNAIDKNYKALLPKEGTFASEDHFFVLLAEMFSRCCLKNGNLASIKGAAEMMNKHNQIGCLSTLLTLTEIMRTNEGINTEEADQLILWLKPLTFPRE